jgi:hypothetical protein
MSWRFMIIEDTFNQQRRGNLQQRGHDLRDGDASSDHQVALLREHIQSCLAVYHQTSCCPRFQEYASCLFWIAKICLFAILLDRDIGASLCVEAPEETLQKKAIWCSPTEFRHHDTSLDDQCLGATAQFKDI